MTQYQLPFNNPDLEDGFGSLMSPRTRPHRGLDFAQSVGTPYGSIAAGVIADKRYGSELGYYTVVAHPDGMYSGYCHSNQPSSLPLGAAVTRGQIINTIGNTGFITGPHLHLTLSTNVYGVSFSQVQDPYPYIMARLDPETQPDAAPPVAQPSNRWTDQVALRPAVTLKAASGKIRITISAYGAGGLVTYSIDGVRNRDDALKDDSTKRAELLLTNDGALEHTTSRTWVQTVPTDRSVTVQVECYGARAGAFVASPSIIAEVVY